jgi:hypothetical protein
MVLEFSMMTLLKKETFYFTHAYKSKVEIWATCAQYFLEVMQKRPKIER